MNTSIETLIDTANQLNGLDYNSPKVMIWKKNVYDHVRSNYGTDYVKMLDRIFRMGVVSRSRTEANSRYQEKIRNTVGLLQELRDIEPINTSSKDLSKSGDEVKDIVIQWLYEQQREDPERSIGWNKYEIMDELEDEGVIKSEIALAIDFLDDEGYFKSTSQNKVKYYRLSSKAQARVLPPSDYSKKSPSGYARITTNNGIIIIGDNYGTVHSEVRNQLIESLESLERLVGENDELDSSDKIDIKESSETIKSQLKRKSPDLSIIHSAWSTITAIATLDGFADAVNKVSELISRVG
jgi:hypothetical protein